MIFNTNVSKDILSENYQIIFKESQRLLDGLPIKPYKMNYIQISHNLCKVYIAMKKQIKIYKIYENGQINDNPNEYENLLEVGSEINNIKLQCFSNKKEYLVAVDMKGYVTVFDLLSTTINRKLVLQNQYEGKDDNSTWSLDVYVSQNKTYLAVGSNNQNISMWDLSGDVFGSQYYTPPQRITVGQMEHNIPCVRFSPCGKYLCAATIGMTIKIFDIQDIESIQMIKNVSLKNWGWGIEWISKNFVKNFNFEGDINNLQLEDYLIANSMEKTINLIDLKSKQAIIQEADFGLNKKYNYHQISRYTLIKYIPSMNILLTPPQHTPFLHFSEVIYDNKENKFFLQQIKMKKNTIKNSDTIIFGFDTYQSNYNIDPNLKQSLKLYLLNQEKELLSYEISKKNEQLIQSKKINKDKNIIQDEEEDIYFL